MYIRVLFRILRFLRRYTYFHTIRFFLAGTGLVVCSTTFSSLTHEQYYINEVRMKKLFPPPRTKSRRAQTRYRHIDFGSLRWQ